jgi:hypothetical protein
MCDQQLTYVSLLCCTGLVYKHYGREVIARLAKLPAQHPDVETVYLQVRIGSASNNKPGSEEPVQRCMEASAAPHRYRGAALSYTHRTPLQRNQCMALIY